MPNGGDRSWVRLCAAIDGFRLRHGRWPARVRLSPHSLADLRDHVFQEGGFARLETRLEFVPDSGVTMVAEDDSGASYDYGKEGFPPPRPHPDARH